MDRAVSQHELFDPHHVPTVVRRSCVFADVCSFLELYHVDSDNFNC